MHFMVLSLSLSLSLNVAASSLFPLQETAPSCADDAADAAVVVLAAAAVVTLERSTNLVCAKLRRAVP